MEVEEAETAKGGQVLAMRQTNRRINTTANTRDESMFALAPH